QDGELMSHIDVANKLRKLQNKIRTNQGNDNFQIFVVLGNHDLYNPESWRFDNANGQKTKFFYTTRMDISMIYAGLGYPNISNEDATNYYSGLTEVLPSGYEFTNSYLSSDFSYTWQFLKNDGEGKTRTFSYGTDATSTDKEQLCMHKFLTDGIVNTIDNSSGFAYSDQCYAYELLDNDHYAFKGQDLEIGELTYIAQRKDCEVSIVGMDVVLSNVIGGHILGGCLQSKTMDWMTKNENFAKPYADTIVVGQCHHSVLPHWGMEEEVTTGFIIYNWQEVADFLADYGMRYVYTGHMHANDTASRVSFNGNQIIDMETSANVSVGSSYKVTRIHYGNVNGVTAENSYLSCFSNVQVHCPNLFDKVYKDDKYGYVAQNKLGEFLDYNGKNIINYSNYALRRVYQNMVNNILSSYLKPSITQNLGDILSDLTFGGINLGSYADDAIQLADNLISEINTKILTDYEYKGNTAMYKLPENKVFGYLEELVLKVCDYNLNTETEEQIGVYGLVIDAYASHCAGTDVAEVSDLSIAKQSALKSIYSGEFVHKMFEILLDKQTGLYKIIEGLQNTTLDLSKNISSDLKSLINLFGPVIGLKGENKIDLANFNLGKIVKIAASSDVVKNLINNYGIAVDLENNSITEVLDDVIDKYLTESLEKALGEYAFDVVSNFACDGGHQDVFTEEEVLLKVYPEEKYTYINKSRDEDITIDNGKLPSMITINYGEDPATTQNFTYFTDRRVTDGCIEYVEKDGDRNSRIRVNATNEIYATTKPLIDLGIWCQSGYVEVGRHTIALSDLKANTSYEYRVGSKSKGYWSEWNTFKTANDVGFEVFIGSDMQSSTLHAYDRLSEIYEGIDGVFDNIDFIINPGDCVDNSRNYSQFKWWLDSTDFYANNAMVVASGNHEVKNFEIAKASNLAYYKGVADTNYYKLIKEDLESDIVEINSNVVSNNYNYLYSHFNYQLPDNQVCENGFYYSFNYQGVHFTILNTNDIEDDQLAKTQTDWLVKDLQDNAEKIKVVIMHKSLYSAGSHSFDTEVVGMRKQLTPIFADNNVPLVIGGHDHTYTESYYLGKDGKKILTTENGKNEIGAEGTLYLTMGAMCEKFYNYESNPDVDINTGKSLHNNQDHLQDPVFGKLVYDGKTLSYQGYQYLRQFNENGDVIGGKVVEIKKSLDWENLIAIILVGFVVILLFVVIVIAVIKAKKVKPFEN
ncbi:MAG: metallophosphoesterase family protein, partial [Clostridia bacterium]